METQQMGEGSLTSRLNSLDLSHKSPTTTHRHIDNLPPEILRHVLEFANTCNAPNYITLAEVVYAISQIQPQECIFNIPGLSFSVSNQAPPLLALLWARRTCRMWRTISDDIIYQDLAPDAWFTPEIGDSFLDFLRLHLELREVSEHCYGQTHTMTTPIPTDSGPGQILVVLHLIVVHHKQERQTSLRVFRQNPRLFERSPRSSQDPQIWQSCDCIRPQSAGVAVGPSFIHILASDDELQKVVQLVWRTSFRMGSNQLIAGLQHLAVARRLLDA